MEAIPDRLSTVTTSNTQAKTPRRALAMSNGTALSSSSGPVLRRRNLITSSKQRKSNGSLIRTFFITLIALVIALTALAVHLSQIVMMRQQSTTSLVHSTASTMTNDRVYCMIPFIWNPEIYHVIMETWGKRCDTINFFTDSIVGGKLQGDKILDDPTNNSMGYKPYYEYPEGTFPENVIFINMTRSWFDCEDDGVVGNSRGGRGGGVKKVCRHIWEKM